MAEEAKEPKEPLRKVVDSTVAIAFARFFMPIALAVIGWLMTTSFGDLKDSNKLLWSAFNELKGTLGAQAADVAVLKTKMDSTTKAVDRLTGIVDQLHHN